MKKKELLSILQTVEGFANPKLHWEQYTTGATIAADYLYTAAVNFDDIVSKSVLDLGCGTGMLSVGAMALGAGHVTSVDIDGDALESCRDNLDSVFEDHDKYRPCCSILQADVAKGLSLRPARGSFDTVLMNPPFGTKGNKGLDIAFLKKACDLADVVYSLHKSSTRQHVLKSVLSWKRKAEIVGRFRYDLPASYKFHSKQTVDIEVDLLRVSL